MHKYAQIFSTIFIDARDQQEYRARQIEPESLETLRITFEGATA